MSWNSCCAAYRGCGGCTRPCCPYGSCGGSYRPQFGNTNYNPCGRCYGGSRCGGCYR